MKKIFYSIGFLFLLFLNTNPLLGMEKNELQYDTTFEDLSLELQQKIFILSFENLLTKKFEKKHTRASLPYYFSYQK